MALKDYPQWVLVHKGKGREIRHINGKYYLYLYHNEKIGDVRKKITDQYLGRITEDGLIPPAIKTTEYIVLLYGLTAFIFSSCEAIINSLIIRYPSRHTKLLSLAILDYFFNNNIGEYNLHYISIIFPNPQLKNETPNVQSEINRIISMIDHSVKKILKQLLLEEFKLLVLPIFIVGIKDSWTLAEVNENTKTIVDKYNIELEIKYGQDK